MRLLNKAFFLAFGISALSLITGCPFDKKKDQWLGFVYPDKSNLGEHTLSGSFATLDSCIQASRRIAGKAGSFECGLNCKQDPELGGINICEETTGNEK